MDFYYSLGSPPCRAVIMTAKALGVELNRKKLNILGGEHLKPEYLKINPQHVIPTIVDNGFTLWESRAILVYLVEKYGNMDDTLYPKTPKLRALINQRLYFDMGTLYPTVGEYYYPIYRLKQQPDPEKYKKIESAFDLLNTFLANQTYVAGDHLTIADISLLATVSTFEVAQFDISKYPNVSRWYDNCKKIVPGWEENWEGCLLLKSFMS